MVHNGIISNYEDLKQDLKNKGYKFQSQTDTEVIAHLIHSHLASSSDKYLAVREATNLLQGSYAIGVIFKDQPDLIIAAKKDSPLVLGYQKNRMLLASDGNAIKTGFLTYLKDGDIALLNSHGVKIYDQENEEVIRDIEINHVNSEDISKGNFPYYMLKEIYEQPDVLQKTYNSFFAQDDETIEEKIKDFSEKYQERMNILACGTSYHAGLIAEYWFSNMTRMHVKVDFASEFYNRHVLHFSGTALLISQSGETADTLSSLRYCKDKDQKIISVVNVPKSNMDRESDLSLLTLAGPEIGVASTKAFTTQLMVLLRLTLAYARRDGLSKKEYDDYKKSLSEISSLSKEALQTASVIEEIAQKDLKESTNISYLGRGTTYPLALEGALKFKEITYVPASGYPVGELKHGPLALIDDKTPVVVIAPHHVGDNGAFSRMKMSMDEILSRKGNVIFISNHEDKDLISNEKIKFIKMPDTPNALLDPFVYSIPVQLLAYYTAVAKGLNVDKPRNLAKCVTVSEGNYEAQNIISAAVKEKLVLRG